MCFGPFSNHAVTRGIVDEGCERYSNFGRGGNVDWGGGEVL